MRTRTYTSIRHALWAGLHARDAATAEEAWGGLGGATFDEDGWNRITGAAAAAVFSSVAMLEAAAREVLQDAADGSWGPHGELRGHAHAAAWAVLAPRALRMSGVMAKLEAIAQAAGVARLPEERQDDVRAVVGLRNWLIHAAPEWESSFDLETRAPLAHSLEDRIAGRFPPNAKLRDIHTGFLQKHLSAGCAKWALGSCVAFSDAFHASIGLRPPYDHVRGKVLPRSGVEGP